jgi:hypothetical protein
VDLRFDGIGGAEVGFGLAPWARGKGVMTRALRLALAWGFGLARIDVMYWRGQLGVATGRRTARLPDGGDGPWAAGAAR